MENPECAKCEELIEDETNFVSISGGTVHRGEAQGDAGGGIFHPDCSIEYIKKNYSE